MWFDCMRRRLLIACGGAGECQLDDADCVECVEPLRVEEPVACGANQLPVVNGTLHCCLKHLLQLYAWLANCNSSLPPPLQCNIIVINCSLLA
jgi:hypothetical protein